MVWDCLIVGLLLGLIVGIFLYITYNLWLMLLWQPLHAIYCRAKMTTGSDVTMATTPVVYCRAKKKPKDIVGCLVPLS
jgi:hypothetical protein